MGWGWGCGWRSFGFVGGVALLVFGIWVEVEVEVRERLNAECLRV